MVPSFVVHLDEVAEVEGAYRPPFDTEKLSIYRDLGRAAGSKTLGFGHERLPPGRRTSFTHAHEHEEEFVYVLAGTCHVRLIEPGAEPCEIPLRAGHVVSFPAGTGIAHTFVNLGTEECLLLVVGERRANDRWFYPEDAAYDAHLAATRPERSWTRDRTVRAAVESDAATILALLQRKAEFDRSMRAFDGQLTTSEDAIRATMFGSAPFARARLAELDGAVVGLAVYYFPYSSFRGRPSLWLDDLFVLDEARGRGVGTTVMRDLARIARQHGCSEMTWTAAVDNTRGIAFYERLGATRVGEPRGVQLRLRLDEAVIEQLAAGPPPPP